MRRTSNRSTVALALQLAVFAACSAASPSTEPPVTPAASPPLTVPATEVALNPGDDIQAVIDAHPAGTTYLIKAGVHRLAEITPKDGDIFIGEIGAVLSGATVVTTFQRQGLHWVAAAEPSAAEHNGFCEDGYNSCVLPEQLFVDGEPLWRADSLSELGPGDWFFDYENHQLFVLDNPAGHQIELSRSVHAFSGNAADVTIRGLLIEKYANPAQSGAIEARQGVGWLVVDNEVRHNHGEGVATGDDIEVRGNHLHHNGRLGVGGTSENTLVENNEISHNCFAAGFACFGWGGGGAKFGGSHNLVLRGNFVHHNKGGGLHTDVGSVNALIEDNVVTDNDGNGISVEITYGATIRNNSLENNGVASDGSCIVVLSSTDVNIHNNTATNCGNGITARQVDRGSGQQGVYRVENLFVHDNIITMAEGFTGLAADDASYYRTLNNVFQDNTYDLAGGDNQRYFKWEGGLLTLEEWQAFGNDTNDASP